MAQRPKLLIVDDNVGFSESIRLILQDEYEIQLAHSGFEALEKAKSNLFDLILLDIRLPRMDGLETLKRLKTISPESEVIMITAYGDVRTIKSALRLGAVDYLEKTGFLAHEIKEILGRAMRDRRARLARRRRLEELRSENKELIANLYIIETEIEKHRNLGYADVVKAISTALNVRDDIVTIYARSVEEYVLPVARRLDLSQDEEINLRVAAALHDVGMLAISETILSKPGPLTQEEWETVKRHPDVGASIIKSLGRWPLAAEIVLYHHERMDGSGYPFHLKGDQIPLAARIVAVADAYDAMISERPYRRALSRERAIQELMRDREKFGPDVVDLFCESLQSLR